MYLGLGNEVRQHIYVFCALGKVQLLLKTSNQVSKVRSCEACQVSTGGASLWQVCRSRTYFRPELKCTTDIYVLLDFISDEQSLNGINLNIRTPWCTYTPRDDSQDLLLVANLCFAVTSAFEKLHTWAYAGGGGNFFFMSRTSILHTCTLSNYCAYAVPVMT